MLWNQIKQDRVTGNKVAGEGANHVKDPEVFFIF